MPRYSYVLAVLAGFFVLPFVYLLALFAALPARGGAALSYAIFIFGHGALGAAFGLVWPGAKWRWGVWLCAGPACLVSFLEADAKFFLLWVGMTLLPACVGAYTAAALHPRLVAAVRN